MFRNDDLDFVPNKNRRAIHEGVVPIEILRGKHFKCYTKAEGGQSSRIEARPWRLSPFGLELEDNNQTYKVGDQIRVDIAYETIESTLNARVISCDQEGDRKLSSLRFSKRLDGSEQHKPRASTRWLCDPLYTPVAKSRIHGSVERVVYFRAAELSLNGMGLTTSARNRGLVPGSKLDVNIQFPLGPAIDIMVSVKYVRWSDQSAQPNLLLGVEIERGGDLYRLHAGQYILEFGTHDGLAPTPKMLRDCGFPARSQASHLEFGYAQTAEEYEEVLRLRALCFGVTPQGQQWQAWGDKHDAHSRILIGKFRGKIICSTRMIFQKDSTMLEQAAFVQIPDSIPSDTPIIECGRTCTLSEYRGNDLLSLLFRFIVITMLEAGQRYMTINCTRELLPMYESTGARQTGASFVHPNDKQRHYVLLYDAHRMVYGNDMHPVKWMTIVGENWNEVSRHLPDHPSLFDRVRLQALLKARPLLARLVAAPPGAKKKKRARS